MTKDSPGNKPASPLFQKTLSLTGNKTKDRKISAKRQRLRQLANLDAVIPSEREKLFFKFYQQTGKSIADTWEQFCRAEGKTKIPSHKYGQAFVRRPGIKKLLKDYHHQMQLVTERQLAKYAITKERVMEELVKLAFTNITDTMSWDKEGLKVKSSEEVPEEAKAAISDVMEIIEPGGTKKVRLKHIDKTKALELIGKQLGLFRESVEHNHKHLQVQFVIEK